MLAPPILELRNISKAFPGVQALRNAALSVERGEVHALLGGNGAGKSTLVNIIAGRFPPDEGEILIDGQVVLLNQPRDSIAQGISVIYQELVLVPELSVAENIFLGRLPKKNGTMVDWRRLESQAADALAAAAVAEAEAGAWRSSGELTRKYLLHGRTFEVRVSRTGDGWSAIVDGAERGPVPAGRDWSAEVSPSGVIVTHNDRRWVFLRERRRRTGTGRSRAAGANVVRAPMPGTMIEVLVAVGDEVKAGQTLAVMEAMKIEHLLSAPNAGVVKAVHTSAGASVDEDAVLIELGASS